jgi:hypothetical protein
LHWSCEKSSCTQVVKLFSWKDLETNIFNRRPFPDRSFLCDWLVLILSSRVFSRSL